MKTKIISNIRKIIVVISVLVATILTISFLTERPTHADSGFSTSHSSGGSSHSSSSSSSRSSRSSSSSSSSRSSGNGSGEIRIEAVVLALGIIIVLVVIALIQNSPNKNVNANLARIPIVNDTQIENQIRRFIPNFNKVQFLSNCYKMYCDIQVAWMNFKLEDVRDMLTDELYTMYESQLATLEVKNQQNVMKDFVLRSSYLKNVVNQNGTITITTGFVIEFYDYIADRTTGRTINGNSRNKMRVTYEMKFRQSLNVNNKIENCPNCGAPVKVNSSGICDYCKSKLVSENTQWVLTEKKSLNQMYI